VAFSGVEGMLETTANFNEALVRLFVDRIGVSCVSLFFRSLDKGMGDSGNSWSGVGI